MGIGTGGGFGLSAGQRLQLVQRLAKRRLTETFSPDDPRDFSTLPALRDFGLMREAMQSLDIPSPFNIPHEARAGARSRIAGREVINFSSYDYLGLNGDPRIAAAAHAAIDHYGVSASASRIVSGERPVHAALESALAAHHGTGAALAFVSGHATNVTVIGHLMGPRDVILHDAAIHNSCLEGIRLSGARRVPFAHNDWAAAEAALAEARRGAERALVLIEGHYSMDGDVPDLARFVALARRHDAWLMVDEAHALGVLGATGRGLAEAQGVDPTEVDIWMGTLSKTLASCGGYIAASAGLVDWLRHTAPGYVYSVGIAPALAAAAVASLAVLRAEPERVARLNRNAARFLALLRERGFDTGGSAGHAIVPVLTRSSIRAGRLSAALAEAGVNVQPIIFPAVPEQAARLRFFLSATHTAEDLHAAADALVAADSGQRRAG
ncbi:aminotransferase class I/II-fold pyridoxal phosphate-dependent enzyme [Humitalea sp. 24SJ18S-53]|uniref:aminotransferase class I/II-fold pyridoxal phosphate-dependent enzyme n=1 Tax=Humitalea sp. 24SJ18S-53 TaxID=3422307 RepID=UPI003D67F3B2